MKKTILTALAFSLIAASAHAQTDAVPVVPVPAAPVPAPVAAAPAAKQDWMTYKSPYSAGQADKSQPHRSNSEIVTWSQNKATDALSLTPENIATKLAALRPLFTDAGWAEYVEYMRSSKMSDLIQKQNYGIGAIMNGEAQVINQGEVGGAYRWMIDLPVVISFSQKAADGTVRQMNGGKFRLTLGLGRMTGDVLSDDMKIESWKLTNM